MVKSLILDHYLIIYKPPKLCDQEIFSVTPYSKYYILKKKKSVHTVMGGHKNERVL